jgi:hypothetical protein
MSHADKIKDCDAFFVVDPITRQIINKTPAKIVIMQGDHNSERFTFSLPRYIEGHDMAESARAKLHYKNATKPDVEGMYWMNDLQIDPEDSEKVKCSWLISGNVTKEAGAIAFLIEFECYEENEIVYSWHTQAHKGISVGETFGCEEEIESKYPDIFDQWEQELFGKGNKALSEGSVSMGYYSVAGIKGYYCYKFIINDTVSGYRALVVTDKQYTKNDNFYQYNPIIDTSKLAVGDKISIGDGRRIYFECSTIVDFSSSYIVVDTVPFEHFKDANADDLEQSDRFIFIANKPDVGHSTIGDFAISLGNGNKAINFSTFSCGMGNVSAGSGAFTEGCANFAEFLAHAEGLKTVAAPYAHAQNMYTKATGEGSTSSGYRSEASGTYADAGGQETEASAACSHSQNFKTKATAPAAHAQNNQTEASGENSDATGFKTKSKAKNSHTGGEENTTETTAVNGFTEGYKNTNRAPRAFIAGGQWNSTTADANDSLVHGIAASASAAAQRVGGKYPKGDPKYAEIVGNGKSSSARSNAYTLDWDGNAWFMGSVECNGIIMKSPNGTRFKLSVSDSGELKTTAI